MLTLFRPNVEKLEAEGNIQGLIDALQYTDDNEPWAHEAAHEVRESAAEALGRIGDERAVEPLIAALKDEDVIVPLFAAEALAKIGQPSVEPLMAALKEPHGDVRRCAADALGEIGDKRAVEPLIAALKGEDVDVSYGAAEALAKIGQPSVEPLIAALKDENMIVRSFAAMALGKVGDERAVEPLIVALKDQMRKFAAEALGKIGDGRAVEPLIAALKDQQEDVRKDAAEALVKIGQPSVEPLIATLKDQDKYVRQRAAEALGKISGLSPEQEQALAEQKALAEQEALAEQKALEEKKQKDQEKLLKTPVFEWSGSSFVGTNPIWVKQVQNENQSAIVWFNAQNFIPIPDNLGDKFAAEYCFDMASMAQNSGIIKEAWAGFHQALRRYCRVKNEKMIGLTCFNLGKVYGVQKNWEMAQLMFRQSVYMTEKIGDLKGYAWSLFYLGDVFKQQGNQSLAKQLISKALPFFRQISPEIVPEVEKALALT